MSGRAHVGFVLAFSIIPLLGVFAAIALLWNKVVRPADVIVFLVMYVFTALGVSTGYHRLFAHNAFKTGRAMRVLLATAGAVAGQGPPLIWAAHHRRHHRFADKAGDPHSPWVDQPPGVRGALKGLWHAHLGWLLNKNLTSDPLRYCPDLVRDRDIRFISKHYFSIVIAGLLVPGLLGYAMTHDPVCFLTGVLWGGLVRFFLLNQVIYTLDSVGHYFGPRRFDTPDESRNVSWLSIPSLGESWHNNHHAFPKSASFSMRWWELDITALVINGLEKMGLVWDVIRIDPKRIEERAAGLSRIGGGRFAPSVPPKPPAPLAEMPKSSKTSSLADVE